MCDLITSIALPFAWWPVLSAASFGGARAGNCAFYDGKTAFLKKWYKHSPDFDRNETLQTWGSRLHESSISRLYYLKNVDFPKMLKISFWASCLHENSFFHVLMNKFWKQHLITRCRLLKDVSGESSVFDRIEWMFIDFRDLSWTPVLRDVSCESLIFEVISMRKWCIFWKCLFNNWLLLMYRRTRKILRINKNCEKVSIERI
jgi:hypothetical protein